MVAHLFFAQGLGAVLNAGALVPGAVQGADGLDTAQQLHHGAVISALVSISSTRMPFWVLICRKTMKVPTGITSTTIRATGTGSL